DRRRGTVHRQRALTPGGVSHVGPALKGIPRRGPERRCAARRTVVVDGYRRSWGGREWLRSTCDDGQTAGKECRSPSAHARASRNATAGSGASGHRRPEPAGDRPDAAAGGGTGAHRQGKTEDGGAVDGAHAAGQTRHAGRAEPPSTNGAHGEAE